MVVYHLQLFIGKLLEGFGLKLAFDTVEFNVRAPLDYINNLLCIFCSIFTDSYHVS